MKQRYDAECGAISGWYSGYVNRVKKQPTLEELIKPYQPTPRGKHKMITKEKRRLQDEHDTIVKSLGRGRPVMTDAE